MCQDWYESKVMAARDQLFAMLRTSPQLLGYIACLALPLF